MGKMQLKKDPYNIVRIGKTSVRENIPPSHQHKKHLFLATIEGQKTVIIHFSGELYCQDPDYFRRVYQVSRDFYGGQSTKFIDRKLGPSLLGYDDETMTLIIERAVRDLSDYFSSNNEEEVQEKIKVSIELLRDVWESFKEKNSQYPRYISAFLKPEYPFLEGKRVEKYLKDKAFTLCKQTQEELKAQLKICTHNTLLKLVQLSKISRKRIDGVFLYMSTNLAKAKQQMEHYNKNREKLYNDVSDLILIEILLEVIHQGFVQVPPRVS